MRSSFVVATALVVGSLAVPAQHQPRAVVVDWDIVYETKIVTVTAPAPAATGYGHGHGQQHKQPRPAPASTSSTQPAPAPQSQSAVAPVYSSQPAPQPAPSSSTSSSAAPSSSALSSTQPTGYTDRVVWHHNKHRANHSAVDVTWSDALASTAQKIAETCVYAHSMQVDGGGYGQNIAAGIDSDGIGEVITGLFYNNEFPDFADLFGEAQPSMDLFEKWGHLTQVVWKGTTSVGCYTADCSGSGLANVGSNTPAQFTVCNYGPPGNYAGEYGQNVGIPLGMPTLQGFSA